MRLLLLLLLCIFLVVARSSSSSSRGSSSSRSSSRSKSSSSSSRSSTSSSSRSSSSSKGWLSSGSSSRSKSKSSSSSSSGRSSSSGGWSLSSLFKSSKSSSGSSIGAKNSRGKSAARDQVSSGSSIFSSFSRTPQIGSRGSSASRASVVGSPYTSTSSTTNSGTTKQSSFQKIRGKITEAAKKHLPGLALKAAKKLGPKLASYISRRRAKTGMRVGGGSATTVYLPAGHYPSSSYGLSSGSYRGPVPQQTHYEAERPELNNETRFTEVETRDPSVEEIFIPYNDDLLAECPEKVDAFLQMDNISFVFEDHHMFLIEDGSLNQTVAIYDLFPGGIHKVDASVFDPLFEIVLLFRERQVYGFHWNDTENGFKALSGFPKTLPDSIPFKPTAAFAGQDGYPILVSEKGEAAAYDVYLNDEVKLGNETASYLENLPQPLRGISDWNGDTAVVFTDHQVYQYDLAQKRVVGEPETLANFLNCFFVDIPSADEKTK